MTEKLEKCVDKLTDSCAVIDDAAERTSHEEGNVDTHSNSLVACS